MCGIKGKDNDMSHFSHNDIDNLKLLGQFKSVSVKS